MDRNSNVAVPPASVGLVATGVRVGQGNGTPVIVGIAGKQIQYVSIKTQRLTTTGDVTISLLSGSTVLDAAVAVCNGNIDGFVNNYPSSPVGFYGGVNEPQYLSLDKDGISVAYWILYRLVTA